MGWRWRKVINLGGGLRANMARRGIGWSWGIPGFRVGKSAYGTIWISIGIPGTGLYFTRVLGSANNTPNGEQRNDQARADDEPLPGGIKKWRDIK